ncbi:MAG TPA: AsmA-like C-terminal region-containing protein, partial [Pirellulaceae bacterium]|nr:AsmA-like C-terminal region-containing protein [Pirellulaceae bacterium]
GNLGITMPPGDGLPGLDWNLMFDVEDGSLQAGLPANRISGQVQFVGKSDGNSIVSRGQLDVDSAMVRGIQLTQIRGPLFIDSQRLRAGTWAERDVQGRVPRWVTANVMGGKLALDGEFVFADGRFNLYTTLENADLKRVTQELSPSQRNLTGKVFALVSLGGTTQGVHTWRGQGEARLTEANIYELPVMVSLLSLLSIKPPDRTAFTNSNMEFRIEGDDVEFTHIDFAGDAISLKGRGWMNNRQEVNLAFYSQLGRDEMQLPIFRPVVGEINRQFLLIEVTGPLDHPNVTKTPFPRLNEQLAQMFPELAVRAEERREDPQRGLWGGRKLLPGGNLWPRNE